MADRTLKRGWKISLLILATLILTLIVYLALPKTIEIPITGEEPCPLVKGTVFVNPQTGSKPPFCWALIGGGTDKLQQEYAAGIRIKTFSLSWREMYPAKGQTDPNYIQRKRGELDQLRKGGFGVILLLGYHDIPAWIHTAYPDSYYVNQYGDVYQDTLDAGDANVIYNPAIRNVVDQYIQYVFSTFGTDFAAVRAGGGRYGELTYPPATYAHKTNCYWNFDTNALSKSPAPGWKPGDPSPNGEATKFLNTYLAALAEYQNWQIQTVRKSYAGPIMVLYPSWGMRPGDDQAAVKVNLNGSTSAEINGEVQRGFDFARQIAALQDPKIIVTTTWLDADASRDLGADPRYWSPVKYLASLASQHPQRLPLFGENTGQGNRAKMNLSATQMERYGLIGMAWYSETELLSGQYAGLKDYQQVIAKYNLSLRSYLALLQFK
jgi:hypothetical protein